MNNQPFRQSASMIYLKNFIIAIDIMKILDRIAIVFNWKTSISRRNEFAWF